MPVCTPEAGPTGSEWAARMSSGGAIARLSRLRGRQQRVQPRNCTRARAISRLFFMDVVAGAGDANFAGEAGAEHDAPSSFFTFPRTAAETVRTSSPSSDQLGQLPVTVLNSGGGPLKSPARHQLPRRLCTGGMVTVASRREGRFKPWVTSLRKSNRTGEVPRPGVTGKSWW